MLTNDFTVRFFSSMKLPTHNLDIPNDRGVNFILILNRSL